MATERDLEKKMFLKNVVHSCMKNEWYSSYKSAATGTTTTNTMLHFYYTVLFRKPTLHQTISYTYYFIFASL